MSDPRIRAMAMWMATAWATLIVALLAVVLWRLCWALGAVIPAIVALFSAIFGESGVDGTCSQLWAFWAACAWMVTLVLMLAVLS